MIEHARAGARGAPLGASTGAPRRPFFPPRRPPGWSSLLAGPRRRRGRPPAGARRATPCRSDRRSGRGLLAAAAGGPAGGAMSPSYRRIGPLHDHAGAHADPPPSFGHSRAVARGSSSAVMGHPRASTRAPHPSQRTLLSTSARSHLVTKRLLVKGGPARRGIWNLAHPAGDTPPPLLPHPLSRQRPRHLVPIERRTAARPRQAPAAVVSPHPARAAVQPARTTPTGGRLIPSTSQACAAGRGGGERGGVGRRARARRYPPSAAGGVPPGRRRPMAVGAAARAARQRRRWSLPSNGAPGGPVGGGGG